MPKVYEDAECEERVDSEPKEHVDSERDLSVEEVKPFPAFKSTILAHRPHDSSHEMAEVGDLFTDKRSRVSE